MIAQRLRRSGLMVFAVALAAAVALSGRAASAPSLPPIPADQLLASVIEALQAKPAVSGEVSARLDLGLPDIPALPSEDEDESSPLDLLSGDQRIRLWRSPDGLRIAVLTDTGEQALIANREEAWRWDAETLTATRLPVGKADAGQHDYELSDPLALARRFIDHIEPSTAISVIDTSRVAGREAYTLVLRPRTPKTLVERVEIGVDAERRLPLRVAVYGRDVDAPAIEAAFTSVSFAAIEDATFSFTPPPGATVQEADPARAGRWREGAGESIAGARTFGSGWATATALPYSGSGLDSVLPFTGTLFSARLAATPAGSWLLFGAVRQQTLVEVQDQLR